MPNKIEVGCDEAGRGCLAGPVVAAAVILAKPIAGLDDSKKLSESKRNALAKTIKETALCYGIASVSPERIDEINILQASIEAMHLALKSLKIKPDHILVDGNKFNPFETIPHTCVIKGDGIYQSIAAASILAKTARDIYMKDLHSHYPVYQWNVNKGYPTKAHLLAIKNHGYCPAHRTTFGIVKQMAQKTLFD